MEQLVAGLTLTTIDMSSTSVRRSASTAEDASPGCFGGLFKLRRGGNKRPAALRNTLNPIPADDHVLDASLAELPPYVRFAHGWSGGINEQQNGQYISLEIEKPPAYDSGGLSSDVISTMENKLKELSPALRELSLDIWTFMASHGFTVTPHYLDIDTAFRAAYTHSSSDGKSQKNIRVIGVNSEMDALPGIGHGCGHNLIAMSGVAVSLAIQAALIEHDIPGTIVLLGTPAEEEGGGKIVLLERGAYVGMDACIMSHPTSGPDNFSGIWPGVACQHMDVEFFGHGAHAGSAPWEGQNALDAAFVAYAGISALRQQIKPDQRVHGIVVGKDWAPNGTSEGCLVMSSSSDIGTVIPDYAKLRYIVRAANWVELEALRDRVIACFDAAALATSCKIEVKLSAGYFELRNNDVLGRQYANVVGQRYGMTTVRTSEGAKFSTDFGNVTHTLPALHPAYSIPTEPNGSNHTPQFVKAATTPEAHVATLKVALGLAATGVQVLADADFARKVKQSFEDSQAVVAAN
ncbi:hypothetical protein BN946_scf184943.g66 [Trametes cinnabarina]|uniref:Peptidase M20 dimerisation domain-containing protein n=1 Tax=Pycnoporus cinnabarinus TaxID=5643 RepID=A0A060SCS9_PYCCI|nr:hypothetical protein BN946_scf184943.g66 [Trametes cinnabarina]